MQEGKNKLAWAISMGLDAGSIGKWNDLPRSAVLGGWLIVMIFPHLNGVGGRSWDASRPSLQYLMSRIQWVAGYA